MCIDSLFFHVQMMFDAKIMMIYDVWNVVVPFVLLLLLLLPTTFFEWCVTHSCVAIDDVISKDQSNFISQPWLPRDAQLASRPPARVARPHARARKPPSAVLSVQLSCHRITLDPLENRFLICWLINYLYFVGRNRQGSQGCQKSDQEEEQASPQEGWFSRANIVNLSASWFIFVFNCLFS